MSTLRDNRTVRRMRIRAKVKGTSARPRLSVYRSNMHLYAQLIDDVRGRTIVSVDDRAVKGAKTALDRAREVGRLLAEKAKEKKVSKAVFDRNGYVYTGRIQALADGARGGGLDF